MAGLNTGNWSTVSSATQAPKKTTFGLAKPSLLSQFDKPSSGIVKTNPNFSGPTRVPTLQPKPDPNAWGQGIGYTFPKQPPYSVVPQQSSSGSPQQQSSGAPQGGGGPSYGGMSAGGGGGGMPAGGWDMGQFVSQLAGVLGGQQEKEPEKPKTQAQLHPNGTPSGANYKDPRMQSPSWIGGANLFDDKSHGHNFTSQLAARPTPAAPAPTTPAPTTPTTPAPTTPTNPKPSKPSHGHGHGHRRSRGRWW